MTCIVGLTTEGRAYLGADSRVSKGWHEDTLALRKIFPCGGLLVGVAGSLRLLNILRSAEPQTPYAPGMDPDLYMETAYADFLRSVTENAEFTEQANNNASMPSSEVLVACGGLLYTIDSDFSVCRSANAFVAIGSGAQFALGALCALDPTLDAETRVLRALEVAGRFAIGVGAPYYVEQVAMPVWSVP